MARKMGRNLKKAAAGLMACAAIALCAVSPAWGEERAGDVVNVTVPTRIDCALGADGTVTSPGGLEVVNNGPQDLYVAASTVDDFGQKVEFAIDLGGSPLLSRAGGKDVEGEVEFAGSSRKGLGLAVSKLNRTSHAALMDAAAQGEAPMFTVGFRFTFKALQGTMAISGEAKLGKTLTATVSGAQADAKLAYRWYRDGQLIAGAETASYTTNDADLGKKLKCEAYDADGRYVGVVSAEVGPVKGPEAFAVFSADDGSLNFYKRIDVPKAGEQFEGRTVTEVYTGFDTGVFVQTNTPQNTWVDIETSSPWFNRRDEIISSKVIDSDVSVEQLAYWYTRCTNLTTVDLSKLDASRATTVMGLFAHCHSMTKCLLPKNLYSAIELTDMFYQCKSITKVDLNCIGEAREARTLFGLMNGCTALTSLTIPRQIADEMSYAFSGCNSMDNFAFIEDWDVSPSKGFLHTFAYSGKIKHLNLSKWKSTNAETYEGMFAACASLESLDISGLSRLESVENLKMFYNCPKLSRVTLGDGFSWRGANNYLPIQSSDTIPGADGKWYAISDKKGYAPADIPPNKADTYVASPDMLPKETFAVFSEDDGSLNFYHRNIVPAMGSHFEGKTATRVYANFDDKVTHIDVYGHQYPVAPWYEVRDQIKSAKIVDKGIRPIYIDGWFAFLDNCTTISGLRQIDYSRCKSMSYLFLRNTQLTTIDLSGLSLPECRIFGGMFEGCKALKEANLSNIILNSDNNLRLWFMFSKCDNVERIDLSGWNFNQIEISEYIFSECKKLREISLPGNFTWQKPDSYLPTPNASDIPGADGYWYDAATGDAYKPEEIPSNKAATYVAVNPIKAPTVTIEGEPIYGSSLTAKVSGQPAGTTATSYQWQYYDNNLNAWYNSNLPGAKTNTLTLTKTPMGGSCEGFELRCVVNTTAGKKRVPQGISGAVGPVGKIGAFAVFSADDNSLSFYNRVGKPAEGSQYDGRTATKVYADIEKTDFISASNALWADKAPVIRTIRFRDVVKPNSTKNWFANMTSLERISFANLDMSACSDMSSMFYNCTSLSSVDTADVNTASVTSMQNLFENCSKLTALDLSKFRTTSVTNMSRIFSGCSSLSDIKLTGLDVSHVEDMSYMFHNCSALTTLDVSGFRTDAAKNMHSMFFGCSNLRELDLSGFDTTNVAYMNFMFKGDIRLQSVRLGSKFAWKGSEQPYLPAPSATYIPGATGKWYSALTGAGHSPQSIPSNWADTYYASKSLAPSVTIPSSKGSVSGSDIVATINNAPGIDPTYEWHHKGNVSGSVTVAAGMSEIRESRFDVLGEVVGTVRILDSNMFRNGVFIEIENIDTNKVVWSEMFVSNSFTDVRIPRGRYIFRVRNTDPVSHEVYFAYSGEVDEVISTMDRVSTTLAEAYRPGDTIICIVNDRKGQYPSMKSNAYTVGVKSNGDIKTPSAHVDVVESVLVSRDEAKEDSVIAPNAAPPYTTDAGANESGRDTVEMSAPGSKSTESDPDAGKPDDSANEKAFMTAQTDTRPHDQGVNSLESAAGSPPEEDGLAAVTWGEAQ